jgi:hypothetical protein
VRALAATLRDAPPAGTFVGIGGARWDVGAPLSDPVAGALPAFAAAVAAAIEAAIEAADDVSIDACAEGGGEPG